MRDEEAATVVRIVSRNQEGMSFSEQ